MRLPFLIGAALLLFSSRSWAEPAQVVEKPQLDAQTATLHAAFEKRMSGNSLVGRFTTDSTEKAADPREGRLLTEERYDILSVKKMSKGDYWIITARIRYGEHDITLPVPVEVKWAGKIPVIMLDSVAVPGLGTFDAHVLIREDNYAGTWRHDKKGGHLFGKIEATKEATDDSESRNE